MCLSIHLSVCARGTIHPLWARFSSNFIFQNFSKICQWNSSFIKIWTTIMGTLHEALCTVKVKRSRYRPGVAQRVGRGIALLFRDPGTRRGWVVSSTSRPHFTPRKDPVTIVQEAGWAPGPVWTGGKSRPHRDSIPDRPAPIQSLYWLSYPANSFVQYIYNSNSFNSSSNVNVLDRSHPIIY